MSTDPLPRLWLIADASLGDDRLFTAVAMLLPSLAAACGLVGLIERDHTGTPDARRLARLVRLRATLGPLGVPLFVNTRADLAVAAGAPGVQLTARALPVSAVRAHFPALRVAVSTHDDAETAEAAADGAEFALLAPIHAPLSKPLSRPPIGDDGLRRAASGSTLPIVALGGMTPERAKDAMDAGAAGIACLGAVFGASQPDRALDRFLAVLT